AVALVGLLEMEGSLAEGVRQTGDAVGRGVLVHGEPEDGSALEMLHFRGAADLDAGTGRRLTWHCGYLHFRCLPGRGCYQHRSPISILYCSPLDIVCQGDYNQKSEAVVDCSSWHMGGQAVTRQRQPTQWEMEMGQRLQDLRRKAGLSQSQLA